MTVNNKEVTAVYKEGEISYTPQADLADGRVSVNVTLTRKDGKVATRSWSFFVGEQTERLYFGQLHAHTAEYSDGSGTLAEALKYIEELPESANVNFVAFTDHSNYFDNNGTANPEDALYDMTKASEYAKTAIEAKVDLIGLEDATHADSAIAYAKEQTIKIATNNVVNDLIAVLERYENSEEEVYVCGGASIYKQALPYVKRLCISHVNTAYTVDTHFPTVNWELYEKVNEVVYDEFVYCEYLRKE